MKTTIKKKAWAVTSNRRIQVWPDGQLGIWNTKPRKIDVGDTDRIVRVEIREIRES